MSVNVTPAGQPYKLRFVNNSINNWTFVCFQDQPTGLPKNYKQLAWFAKSAAPDSNVTFEWEIDYSFVWSETGELLPGVVFDAGQTKPADLKLNNQIGYTHTDDFYFENQGKGPNPGALKIVQDDTIPTHTSSVGIGMSGAGTFVVQAEPNIDVTFTPTPNYYITFMDSMQRGEVMNITETAAVKQIVFPPNQFLATATLGPDNLWTVSYSNS